MKLGCSSWSYHRAISEGRLDQRQWLRLCAEELELDGVELLDVHFPELGRDYLIDLKRTCADLQLTISCVSVSNDFGVEGEEGRARELAKVKQWVDIAALFGAPVLRVFSGWWPGDQAPRGGWVSRLRDRLGGARRHERWPSLIESLRECAEYAGRQGIVLGLENHNGRGITGTAEEVERCIENVASPWFRLNLDTGDYGDVQSIRRTLPLAVHIHAKLYELDGEGADQRFDWREVMAVLAEGRYRGFLSIEYEGEEDALAAMPRGVRHLRRLLAEVASA